MHIGILSDTHGNRLMVNLALAELRERGITTVLHCGDIDDPETVALFRGLCFAA
jgi:predicted phosphodiesterase